MRAIICDMCDRPITDLDVQNKRQETHFEIHVVECESDTSGEIRTCYDLCYGCVRNMKKILRDPRMFHRRTLTEEGRSLL